MKLLMANLVRVLLRKKLSEIPTHRSLPESDRLFRIPVFRFEKKNKKN